MHRRIAPALIALFVCLVAVSPALADTIYLPLTGSAPAPTATPTLTKTPTKTPRPTAQPTSTPEPVSIQNGGFEAGDKNWSHSPLPLINKKKDKDDHLAHSGSWYALFGESAIADQILSQYIYVPVDKPYLTFWYIALSSETNCSADIADVWVDPHSDDPASGLEPVATVLDFCKSRQHLYKQQSVDLSAYKGQKVELGFEFLPDQAVDSFWVIDDVTFQSKPAVIESTAPVDDPTIIDRVRQAIEGRQ